LLRETGESLGARLADEASVVGIRPAVIRARETAGERSRARRGLRAAMPARSEEGAELAGLRPDDDDRHAGLDVRRVGAGLGDVARETDEERLATEQRLVFALETGGRGVRRDRISIRRRRHLRRPGVEEAEEPVEEGDLRRVIHRAEP